VRILRRRFSLAIKSAKAEPPVAFQGNPLCQPADGSACNPSPADPLSDPREPKLSFTTQGAVPISGGASSQSETALGYSLVISLDY
jgi:hypothetical protein